MIKTRESSVRQSIVIESGGRMVQEWVVSRTTLVGVSILSVFLAVALLIVTSGLIAQIYFESRMARSESVRDRLIAEVAMLQKTRTAAAESGGAIERRKEPADHPKKHPRVSPYPSTLPLLATSMKKTALTSVKPAPPVKNAPRPLSVLEQAVSAGVPWGSIPTIRPVVGGRMRAGFGYRRDPFTGTKRFHHGQDFSAPRGTPVAASADGIVRYSGYKGSLGKFVEIDHGFGFTTWYGHLDSLQCQLGEIVSKGTVIGLVGNTGRSTAPHLHYEIHRFDSPINPRKLFTGSTSS